MTPMEGGKVGPAIMPSECLKEDQIGRHRRYRLEEARINLEEIVAAQSSLTVGVARSTGFLLKRDGAPPILACHTLDLSILHRLIQ
jgi:hypothetical protein